VKRFRSLEIRHSVLPFVLAALALRAFIPAGFMADASGGLTFAAQLCSTLDPGKSGTIELPGESPAPHCERCLAPSLGTALAYVAAPLPDARPVASPTDSIAQISAHQPTRAPTARGPPLA
jgi:hypothetical protein